MDEEVTLYHMPSWLVQKIRRYANERAIDFEVAIIIALKEWFE